MTEILLNVTLNTIKQTNNQRALTVPSLKIKQYSYMHVQLYIVIMIFILFSAPML